MNSLLGSELLISKFPAILYQFFMRKWWESMRKRKGFAQKFMTIELGQCLTRLEFERLHEQAPRRQCCEIINSKMEEVVGVKIRGCHQFESVTPPQKILRGIIPSCWSCTLRLFKLINNSASVVECQLANYCGLLTDSSPRICSSSCTYLVSFLYFTAASPTQNRLILFF